MKFAVIGDIHGNKYALERVLEHIQIQNVDFVVSTGDLVGYLPYPNEVIEEIRASKILVVQGNHDRAIAESEPITTEAIKQMSMENIQKNASTAYTNWCLREENRTFLKHLCSKLVLECEDMKVVIVHGSPQRIDEYLYEQEDHLAQMAEQIQEDVIICGHTHIPYHTCIQGKHFINAGSVGKPKSGDSRSTYVIVTLDQGEVSCSIEKVDYDVDQMIADIKENPMISDGLIEMLRQGV